MVAALVGGGCFIDVAPGSDGSGAAASTSSGASEGSTGGSTSTGGGTTSTTTSATTSDGTSDATDPTTSTSGGSTTTGCVPKAWYLDVDGDGHGDPQAVMMACDAPTGHVPVGDDCDDSRKGVFPGAAETCNGVDDDCDDFTDEFSPQNVECGGCSMSSIGGHIYYRCVDSRTWDDARAECEARYADLVVLETLAEAAALATIDVPAGVAWWIGLGDQAVEGAFVWVDGTPLAQGQANLQAAQPDDYQGAEDCVHLYPSGLWNDNKCVMPFAFVCEGPPVGS